MDWKELAIVGRGRVGHAVVRALRASGVPVRDPLGRGSNCAGARIVLLCVSDREIETAAKLVVPGPIVGHCAASVSLEALAPHVDCFAMHPLLSVTHETRGFHGAAAAVDGSTEAATDAASALARQLGMHAIHIAGEQRSAYHAGASMASNFLVTLAWLAGRVVAPLGVDRHDLAVLMRSALDQWETQGAERALTGPIRRGDEAVVARQRAAVASSTPDALPVWDAMAHATRALARLASHDSASARGAQAASDAALPPAGAA